MGQELSLGEMAGSAMEAMGPVFISSSLHKTLRCVSGTWAVIRMIRRPVQLYELYKTGETLSQCRTDDRMDMESSLGQMAESMLATGRQ